MTVEMERRRQRQLEDFDKSEQGLMFLGLKKSRQADILHRHGRRFCNDYILVYLRRI